MEKNNKQMSGLIKRQKEVIDRLQGEVDLKDFQLFNQIEENKGLQEEIKETRERMSGLEKAKDKIILKLKSELN